MRAVIAFLFLFAFLFLSTQEAKGQSDTTNTKAPKISLSGFADVFYAYDFNQPQGIQRQAFLFNHNRHNEFNLNLGFIKLGLEHSKYRANLALQSGTYANDNYAAEPGLLKGLFEANIGVSLNKKNNLWLDVGVLPSYIGFESAISIDNWTMTRSLLAENSPYFFAGSKLTYNPSDKLEIAGVILNGWQRIQRLNGNSMPSFGTQIKYIPIKKISLNWSTFIGTNDPDSSRRMRYFNNFYGQFQCTERFGLIVGFDIGTQQRIKNSSNYDIWYSPVIIGQLAFNDKLKSAIRAEYYQDQSGIMIPTGTTNGFRTTGLSLNLDYSPAQNIMCRLEGRWLNSKDEVFVTKTGTTNNNFIIGTSVTIKFSEPIHK